VEIYVNISLISILSLFLYFNPDFITHIEVTRNAALNTATDYFAH